MASSRFVQCGNLYTNRSWSIGGRMPTSLMIKRRHKVPVRAERYEDYPLRDVRIREQKIDPITQLEIAAQSRNARVFDRLLNNIDWQGRAPSEFTRTIDLALRMGAYSAASGVSELAQTYYPHEETIKRYNAVLAPTNVIKRRVPADASIKSNRDWLKTHGDEYSGKWVGLRTGELVGAADSLEDLIRSIGDDRKDILITRVF